MKGDSNESKGKTIKRILQKHFVSEETSRNVVKLIRVLEKEILTNKPNTRSNNE